MCARSLLNELNLFLLFLKKSSFFDKDEKIEREYYRTGVKKGGVQNPARLRPIFRHEK